MATKLTPARRGRHGLLLMIGAAVICPCHLPVTLSLLAALLGGTWIGTTISSEPVLTGLFIVTVWALVTWRGLQLLRTPSGCSTALSGRAKASMDAPARSDPSQHRS